MRLEEWRRWLDTQFLDSPEAATPTEMEASVVQVADYPATANIVAESYVAQPPLFLPERIADASPTGEVVSEFDLPPLDQFLPFLRSDSPAVSPTAPAVETAPSNGSSVVEEGPIEVSKDAEAAVVDSGRPVATSEGEPIQPAQSADRPAALPRSAKGSSKRVPKPFVAVPISKPLEAAEFWRLTPRSVQFRMALGDEHAQREPFSRQESEARLDFVQRLLDPGQSLAETARLTKIQPAVVRRLSRREPLILNRNPGGKHGCRLAEALGFIESQSRASDVEGRSR
jgi:hypothetical protein